MVLAEHQNRSANPLQLELDKRNRLLEIDEMAEKLFTSYRCKTLFDMCKGWATTILALNDMRAKYEPSPDPSDLWEDEDE